MNKICNRQIICDVLVEEAKTNKDIVVLCSDSRGSASMTNFADAYPKQFVEVGIAEQNLVSIAAGMAKTGKRPFACSPACFLTTRSYEQVKVDVAYSNTNVKLIGISGGVSYGALGMSHHSAQDFAAMCSVPNMRVYVPSDRFLTEKLMQSLVSDDNNAYIRVSRNPSYDIYNEEMKFEMDRAIRHNLGYDALIIACGEMVYEALEAQKALAKENIFVTILDMYCLKPLDTTSILDNINLYKVVLTIEEHSKYGGLGSMVATLLSENCPKKMEIIALPDSPVITGSQREVFEYYHMTGKGIYQKVVELLK